MDKSLPVDGGDAPDRADALRLDKETEMVANIDNMAVLPRALAPGQRAEMPIQKEGQGTFTAPNGAKVDVGVTFSLSAAGLAMSRAATNEAGQTFESSLEVTATDDGADIARSFMAPDGRGASMTASIERGEDGFEISQQVMLADGRVVERHLEVTRTDDGVKLSRTVTGPDGRGMEREDSVTHTQEGILREVEVANSSGESGQVGILITPDPDGLHPIVTMVSGGGDEIGDEIGDEPGDEPGDEAAAGDEAGDGDIPEQPTDILV